MGFFSNILPTVARIAGDVATFGTNELAGNPIGKFADQVLNPQDPNAYSRELNAQQMQLARENMALQKEFAQKGIQWRVADAAAAGLSPLVAAGASEPGFSPVSAGTVVFPQDTSVRDTGLKMMASMGQDLFRSRLNAMSETDRVIAVAAGKKAAADADFAESQARMARISLNRMQTAPPNPAVPASAVDSDHAVVVNSDGSKSIVPSATVSYGSMADPALRWEWMIKNRLVKPLSDTGWNIWQGLKSSAAGNYRVSR